MCDINDVENALAILVQIAVYPNGISQPSINNSAIRIYPGWPIPSSLDNDLTNQVTNVSIFPSNLSRSTTRFGIEWQTVSINSPTITLTISGDKKQISVGGTISTPQTCMIIVNNRGYNYAVQSTDTLNTIAANFSKRIPNTYCIGNVIYFLVPAALIARVSVSGVSAQEVGREERIMILTVWASSPLIRSQIGQAIASYFSDTFRIGMPDGFVAQLKFRGELEEDILEKVKCYRRDLHFLVEYSITNSETDFTITDNIINLSPYPYPQLLLLDGEHFILLDGELFGLMGN